MKANRSSIILGSLCLAFILTASFTWMSGRKIVQRETVQSSSTLANSLMMTKLTPQRPPVMSEDPTAQADFERKWWGILIKKYEKQLEYAATQRASLIQSMVAFGKYNPRLSDLIAQLENGDDLDNVVLKIRTTLIHDHDNEAIQIIKLSNEYYEVTNFIEINQISLDAAKVGR